MLREDLRDTDIPHRTTVRERICAMWAEHLTYLEKELKVWISHLVSHGY